MEIVLSLIIVGLVGYIVYDKTRPKKEIHKVKPKKITKEEREKQEAIKTSFENLMRYDYSTALRGGRNE